VLNVKLFDCSVVWLCEVVVQHSVLEGLTVLFTSAAQPLSVVSTGRSSPHSSWEAALAGQRTMLCGPGSNSFLSW
jgi:hypothetical protein